MHGALCISSPKHQHTQNPEFYVSIVLLGLMTDLTHQKSAALLCGVRMRDEADVSFPNVCTFRWNPRRDFLPRWAGDVIGVRSARTSRLACDQDNARSSRISKVRIFFLQRRETGWRIVPSLKSPASASSKLSYRSSLRARNRQTAFSDLAVVKKEKKSES